MVGSYVVAWEVRSDRVLSSILPPALARPSYEMRTLPLQERVTKEVADLEAKRAKRFAGARV